MKHTNVAHGFSRASAGLKACTTVAVALMKILGRVYIGTTEWDRIEMGAIHPDTKAWDGGDRKVTCYAYLTDGCSAYQTSPGRHSQLIGAPRSSAGDVGVSRTMM